MVKGIASKGVIAVAICVSAYSIFTDKKTENATTPYVFEGFPSNEISLGTEARWKVPLNLYGALGNFHLDMRLADRNSMILLSSSRELMNEPWNITAIVTLQGDYLHIGQARCTQEIGYNQWVLKRQCGGLDSGKYYKLKKGEGDTFMLLGKHEAIALKEIIHKRNNQ